MRNVVVRHEAGYSPVFERTRINPRTNTIWYEACVRSPLAPTVWTTAPFTRDGLLSLIPHMIVYATEEEARGHVFTIYPTKPDVFDLTVAP